MTTLPLNAAEQAGAPTVTRRTRNLDAGVGDDVTALTSDVLRHRVALGDCSCLGTDEWFPPEPDARHTRSRGAYEERARALCADCPVKAECLELALRAEGRPYGTPHGIFGGMAPWERQNLLRSRRRRAYSARVRTERAEVPA
jgi:WhiB family redox-sensing transcriptional regulator